MRLSTKSRYGVRAIFDIAYHTDGRPTQVRTISKRQGITPRYLEQIFQKLKRAGIVKSIRGPKGGYSLNRKPEKITVGDIIRAVGESVQPVFCVWSPKAGLRCRRESHCVATLIWKKMGEQISSYLDSVTIAQMCRMGGEIGLGRKKAIPRGGSRAKGG